MQKYRVEFLSLGLGLFIFLGLAALGLFLGNALLDFKLLDRSVTVKGLSEREYPADIVLWPITFTVTSNDVKDIYTSVEQQADKVRAFLLKNGIAESEISASIPIITDKLANNYSARNTIDFRYLAEETVTVYSSDVAKVRGMMNSVSDLGKEGIVFSDSYRAHTEYLFTRLNEVKPEMIEEATTQAREVAQKFAADSDSKLGKIKRASQGQFTINDRDSNNPHIKKVRVVSTVEYYLSD